MHKTYLPTVAEVEAARKWHFIDASSDTLGRVATKVATLLAGKNKKFYAPHMDCGDFVVITNAANLRVTGNKLEDKFYFKHTGYKDGAKVTPFKRQMEKDPTKIFELAVKRMLDSNKLRAPRLRRLKVYAGSEHPFAHLLVEKKEIASGKES
ncbi:MAG: 50S ribosomal protein L13 [Elusimicrobiaceae bacterium]